MSHDAPGRTLSHFWYAVLLGFAGLGAAGPLSASKTITCDAMPLVAETPRAGAQLGWSLSVNDGWIATGAKLDDRHGQGAGIVALYSNPPHGQKPSFEIFPDDLQPGDQFGSSVSISGDWLAVGAPVGDGKVRDSGVVYLFRFDGSTWIQKAKLDAADATRGAEFGFSVSLKGKALVVGAPGDSGRGSSAGAAYVFELNDEGGQQTATKIIAGDGRPFDEFGFAVATSGDEIAVGAPFADDLHVFQNFGAAYVFKRTNGGWPLEANGKLTAGAFRPGDIQFGSAVAIGKDRIVVGARGDDQVFADSGSAYVFERNGSDWTPHLLTADDPKQGAQLGTSVQIDGERILIGAPFDGSGAGAAYLFERQSGNWIQSFKFLHVPGGAFGQSVAILGYQVFMGGFEYSVNAPHAGAVATCSIPTIPQPNPHLTCKKTGPGSVEAGGLATYRITVANDGDAAATQVSLSDATPPGLTYLSGPCVRSPCNLGTIGPGQSLPPVTVTFKVPAGCAAPNAITNTATVAGSNAAPQTCSLTTSVPRDADLGVGVSAPAQVAGGGSFQVSAVVTNAGPKTAQGATADVAIGTSAIIAGVPAGCTAVANQPNHFTCLLGDLPCGGSKALDFTVRAPACVGCTAGNPIDVTAEARSQTPDPTLPNRATAAVPVTCPPGVHALCEGISGSMMELTPITETLRLINCGPAPQADNPGDEFTDTLPAGLTLTGASATSGVASTSGNTARWNGAIPAGGTVTITLTASVDAGTHGRTLCNQATVAFDADGNGTNESTGLSDDPDRPGPADPCCFRVLPTFEIPSLSGEGLAALALLLAGLALLRLRRRRSL